MCAVFFCALSAPAQDMEFEPQLEGLPHKKRPGIFHRPAKHSPADQLKYAEQLLAEQQTRKAMKQYVALVHQWHESPEAATAQLIYAGLLEKKRKYVSAFDEFQYLIDNYAGRFPYEEALEHQFRIANHIMTVKRWKFFFFSGFTAPERALPFFEKIVENAPHWDRTAEAQFYIGLIYEQIKQYEPAIKAYEIVRHRFAGSSFAAEASFRRAHCLYITANASRRNETTSRDALSALAGFLKDYPENTNADKAQLYLDELRERLAGMYYDRAVFYDKIAKRPESALIAYTDFIRKFPASAMAEQASKRIDTLKGELESREGWEKRKGNY